MTELTKICSKRRNGVNHYYTSGTNLSDWRVSNMTCMFCGKKITLAEVQNATDI